MTMIEKVARAIHNGLKWSRSYDVMPLQTKNEFEEIAKAAIAAMREPTEEMLEAGGENNSMGDYPQPSVSYERMIDAALKE